MPNAFDAETRRCPEAEARGRPWARKLLALFGWRVEVIPPSVPKCVIVFYPHTSNWDFVFGYLAKLGSGLPLWWMGKDTLFRGPFGPIFRGMGGIPVDRSAPAGMVDALAARFAAAERLWLVIAPEGTRKHTDHWKSGFYRLALALRVPVGLAFIDYRGRRVGVATYLDLTGNLAADLERLRAYYEDKVGLHPDQASTIRFRSEKL
jgi:1-acyl-sn-glycerol-3-phosphate acyltransferase